MDWFPWYPERYKLKTLHLTAEEDGIYRRLLDHYMVTRQPLPDNDFALARITGVDNDCFKLASSKLKAFFKHKKDGLLHHETCDTELDKQDKQSKFYSDRAKRGAKARQNKDIENIDLAASSKREAPLQLATITKTITVNTIKEKKQAIEFDFDLAEFSNITPENKKLWAKAYPAVVIEIELNKAAAWLIANPSQKKSNYNRFLTNWLNRSQDNGGTRGTSTNKITTASGRNGNDAGESGSGSGYGGRKSQTELYGEATARIIARRRAKWETENPGQPFPSESAIPAITADIRDVKEIR